MLPALPPHPPAPLFPDECRPTTFGRLDKGMWGTVTNARRLATRFILASITVSGIAFAAGAASAPSASAAPAPLTLTETWNSGASDPGVILNDAPCGVALASPVKFDNGGTAAVEVGDRLGDLYGLNLQSGAVTPGWGSGSGSGSGSGQGCSGASGGTPAVGINGINIPGSPPVDSTASVNTNGDLYFGAGNASSPVDGGYDAYAPNGTAIWNQVVTNPPTDSAPDGGVQASLPIADGGSLVEGGSLGQVTYALNAATGAPATGWPQFSADSVFSTAAAGDFYGTGSDDFAVGGASSQGFALGKHYANGGHVRIYNDHGGLICSADTNEEVDSSPAVGPILPGGRYGIATGHGQLLPGRERPEHGQGVRHQVQPGVERPRWTGSRTGAPPWRTCRAMGNSPWWRERTTRTARDRSTP